MQDTGAKSDLTQKLLLHDDYVYGSSSGIVDGNLSLDVINLNYDAGKNYLKEFQAQVKSKTPAYLLPTVPEVRAFVRTFFKLINYVF